MAKLTPIPQNNITNTTVWLKKFFHTSHNFVNKMQLVPVFLYKAELELCLFHLPPGRNMVIMANWLLFHKLTSQTLQFGLRSFFTPVLVPQNM